MKVQLIIPPSGIDFGRDKWMMPLGLLSIATTLRNKMVDIEIEVIDGKVVSEEEIIDRLNGDVIGLSIITANYNAAKRIAKVAKKSGKLIVAGGSLITSHRKVVLQEVKEIDVLVRGDGEEVLPRIITGELPSEAYHQTVLDSLPIIDRSFLDTEKYLLTYQTLYPDSPYKRPFSLYTQKGCRYRQKTGGCKFCSIADKGWRARNPNAVWQEIQLLINDFGADLIWEVSDSIASDTAWFESFVSSKPHSVGCDFYFYIRADEISERTAELLSQINCKRVFLGVESGNNNFLKESNKGTDTTQNLRAAKLLNQHNIGINLSFILGFPGENETTIEHTKRYIEQLLPYGVEVINAHVMTPEPGSAYFSMLVKQTNSLDLNPEKLRLEWVKKFCNIPITKLYEACEEIVSLSPKEQERDYGNIVL